MFLLALMLMTSLGLQAQTKFNSMYLYSDKVWYTFDTWFLDSDIPFSDTRKYYNDGCEIELNWKTGECHVRGADLTAPLFNIWQEKQEYQPPFFKVYHQYSIAQAIKNVYIEDGVKNICDGAFAHLENLVSVTFQSSDLESMGRELFYRTPVKIVRMENPRHTTKPVTIDLPGDVCNYYGKNLSSVFERAFYLNSDDPNVVTSPELTIAYHNIFIDRNLEVDIHGAINPAMDLPFFNFQEGFKHDVEFGPNVTRLPVAVDDDVCPLFGRCTKASKFTFSAHLQSLDGRLSVDGDGITEFNIPSTVRTISPGFFKGCKHLVSAHIPEGVKVVPNDCFLDCQDMTSVYLPSSIESIGEAAFYNCHNLKAITIGANVETIGAAAFLNCNSLEQVAFAGNKVQALEQNAFSNCTSLKEIYLPNQITRIGHSAFGGCSMLQAIKLPSNLLRMDSQVFSGCNALSSVSIPASLRRIDAQLFEGSNITNLTIEDGADELTVDWVTADVNEIGGLQYLPLNMQNVYIGRNMRCAKNIFKQGTHIDHLTFGPMVQSVPNGLCTQADLITDITCLSDNPPALFVNETLTADPFNANVYNNTIVNANSSYAEAAGWNQFVHLQNADVEKSIADDNSFTYIYDKVSKTLTISPIGTGAYTIPNRGNDNLHTYAKFQNEAEHVLLKGEISHIGVNAFYGFSHLQEISIPSTVTSIGVGAFSGCNSLKSVVVAPTSAPTVVNSNGAVITDAVASTYDIFPASVYQNAVFYVEVPTAQTNYTQATRWKQFRNFATDWCVGNNVYARINNGILYIRYTGPANTEAATFDYVGDNAYGAHVPWANERERIKTVVFEGNITYIGEELLADCPNLTKVTFPANLKHIGSAAFYGTGITDLELPSTVTTIEKTAFSRCAALKSIVLPETLEEVSAYMFDGCTLLETITIPSSVTSIGKMAFAGCTNLKKVVTYGDSQLLTIGEKAFTGCSSLAGCILPPVVEHIQAYAFEGCSSLTKFTLPNDIKTLGEYAFKNCIGLTDINIPASITTIPSGLLSGCSSLSHLELPETVTSLGVYAFAGTGFTTFSIPSQIESIPDYLLSGCTSLLSVDIPSGVKEIGEAAFYNCTSLSKIALPEDLTVIKSSTFESCCSLTDITLPAALTEIENGAFRGTGLTQITLPANVKKIDNCAFWGTPLASIYAEPVLAPEIFSDNTSAFDTSTESNANVYVANKPNYNWTSWTRFAHLQSYAEGSLGSVHYEIVDSTLCITNPSEDNNVVTPDCSGLQPWLSQVDRIKKVSVGPKITGIGASFFAGLTSLKSIDLSASDVVGIGAEAFAGCDQLEVVYLPGELSRLGDRAFTGCSSLERVYCANANTAAYTNADNIFDAGNNVSLRVPNPDAYAKLTYWKNAKEILPWLNGYCGKSISYDDDDDNYLADGKYMEYHVDGHKLTIVCQRNEYLENEGIVAKEMKNFAERSTPWYSVAKYITEVDLSQAEGLPNLGDYCFAELTNLKQIEIPSTVTTIGSHALYFAGIEQLIVPESVTTIGQAAFYYCRSLKSIMLPSSLKSLGSYALGYSAIEEVRIPEGITDISYLCVGCKNLKYVALPSTLQNINNSAFKECSSLESITIPEGVKMIYNYAFKDCTSLKKINIPATVNRIAIKTFEGCASLEEISIPSSVNQLENGAFSGCTNLSVVTVGHASPLAIASTDESKNPFYGLDCSKITLNVPKHKLADYQQAIVWQDFDVKDATLNLTDANNTLIHNIYDTGDIQYTRNGTAGNYGTFCLPFDIDLKTASCFQKVYTIHDMALYNETTERLRIFFHEEDMDETLPAGTPFIALLNGAVSVTNALAVGFGEYAGEDRTPAVRPTHISVFNWNEGAGGLTPPRDDMQLTFCGTYSRITREDLGLNAGEFKTFNSDATFGKKDTGSLSPFRAFLTQVVSSSAEVKGIDTDFSFAENDETFIQYIKENLSGSDKVYTIDGKVVKNASSNNTLRPGIYIKNGKKVVIK